ncbi:unnamed protein product, partial [Urochloa humidicola]
RKEREKRVGGTREQKLKGIGGERERELWPLCVGREKPLQLPRNERERRKSRRGHGGESEGWRRAIGGGAAGAGSEATQKEIWRRGPAALQLRRKPRWREEVVEEGGSPLTSKSRRESIKGGGEGEGGELPGRTKRAREKLQSERKKASRKEGLRGRAARHPVTVLCASDK